ncbi:MAG: hypothetical protein V1888_03645 [archaeon]
MKVTKSKVLIFSIAIAFVSVFFFAYAVQAFYPAPLYEDYCDDMNYQKNIQTEAGCNDAGGLWTDYEKDALNMDIKGYCDVNYFCGKDYEEARKPYERNVFFANLGLGIVLFVVAFFLGLEAVSSGLMGGAVMLIIYGSIRYWGELSDVWRTMMLGFALAVLIYLGYKKLAD